MKKSRFAGGGESALRREAGSVRRAFLDSDLEPYDEETAIKDHLSLPLDGDLDRILRYEALIQLQLVYAINQLERLQRIRKGEHVSAPVSLQVSRDE